MVKHSLKILLFEHRKIFQSIFGHLSTLCMKGLYSRHVELSRFLHDGNIDRKYAF